MPSSAFWILFVHILSACLFQGGMVFFAILVRNLRQRLSPEEFAGEAVSILRFYHPFILACMGVLIITGAWQLTGLKASMGASFGLLFIPLALKLGFVFLLVLGMSFQFFALGLRLTRGTGPAGNGRPLSDTTAETLQLLRSVERVNLVNVFIGLFAIFFGLALSKAY